MATTVNLRIARLWGALQPPTDVLPGGYRRPLLLVLVAAFLLRLALAYFSPTIHQADEVYQVAEPAHRALYGHGIESWEFRAQARAGLYPALVVPIYWLPVSVEARQLLAAALFTLVSLLPVWVAFHWTARLYGIRGAVVAGLMMATWFELVYFAPKPTGDALGGYFILPAVFFARPGARRRDVFLAGTCLTLAFAFRMQIAPAIGLVGLLALLMDVRQRWLTLAAGGLAAVIGVGLIEWAWWGVPFRGHWGYLTAEFVHGASRYFTRQPLTFFAKNAVLIYGAALPVIAFVAYRGIRRAPILLVVGAALVIPFHLIGHKEYRFLVPALPVLLLAMGLAVAEFTARFPRVATPRALTIGMAGWLVGMVAVSLGDTYRPYWTSQRNHVRAFREIGKQSDACGVTLVGIRWHHTPGYSGLGRDIPIYELGRDPLPPELAATSNYVLLGHKAPEPGPPYVKWLEYSRPVENVYRRPGGCVRNESLMVRPVGVPGME